MELCRRTLSSTSSAVLACLGYRLGVKHQHMHQHDQDHHYMRLALQQATLAPEIGEIPISAVLVLNNEVLAAAHNYREVSQDPTAHAEMIVIRKAAEKLRTWRLTDSTLYVTLEPCVMCAGAAVLARVDRLVYGAADPKAGACESLYSVPTDERLNHRVELCGGILADECGALLADFFAAQRALGKK